jgi:protein ImuB
MNAVPLSPRASRGGSSRRSGGSRSPRGGPSPDGLPRGPAPGLLNQRQPRWLVVWLPAFRVERCGYAADERVAVVAERRNATRLVGLTPACREAGLREEMTAAEARALVSDVILEPLDEVAERQDREALVRTFEQVCDRVEMGEDDALVLEVSATLSRWGGEEAIVERARALAEALGHSCRLALADHPLAALALASTVERPEAQERPWTRSGSDRFANTSTRVKLEAPEAARRSGDVIVPRGEGARMLARLPFTALRPSEELYEAVRTLGVRTIGQWAKLDAASVAGRFGAEGEQLHRVARGRGLPAWTAPPVAELPVQVEVRPEEPVETVDGLLHMLRDGLAELVAQLEARGKAVAGLGLRFELEQGPPVRLALRTARPTADPALLRTLLRPRMEQLLVPAPVVRVVIEVTEAVAPVHGAGGLFDRRQASEPLPELIARFADVLGDDRVLRATLVESWRPESTWRPVTPIGPMPRGPQPVEDDPVAWQEQAAWDAPRRRPSRLLPLPQPVRIDAPDGRPSRLRRPLGWVELGEASGPERLSGDWWHADGGFERDYWVVGLPEGQAWVFEERGQWFVHGWFD